MRENQDASGTDIITNAHRINQGLMPELIAPEGSDFYLVDASEPEEAVRRLLAVVRERIPACFGLDSPGTLRVERFGWTFCPGDKVMQVANDYERDVFNDDLSLITAIDAEEDTLSVSFEGRAVEYGFGEMDELVLAYATTIHKAQGSEYPVVVILLATQHYAMLAHNLLYTGLTRGRRLVVLVGQRKALAMAVSNAGACRRWSKLREWLETGRAGEQQPEAEIAPRWVSVREE